jgi:hypothetical protein
VTIRAATWYRGHHQDFSPLYFNSEAGRFAAPDGEQFGTMYMGEDAFGAFIEAFGQGLRSDVLGMYVSEGLLRVRCLCTASLTRPVRLVDLSSGAGLKKLSGDADSRIADGPHEVSQRWAAAFWAHPEQPDGVLYRARNAPDHRSIALFDRAADAIVAPCSGNALRDTARLAAILDHFGCALIP